MVEQHNEKQRFQRYVASLLAGGTVEQDRVPYVDEALEGLIKQFETQTLKGDVAAALTRVKMLSKTGRYPVLEGILEEKTEAAPAQQSSPKPKMQTESTNMPALPADIQFDPSVYADACPWLDQAWRPWSRTWAPNGYEQYHEMTGIFLLSAIALRRVVMDEGGVYYTNIYGLLAGRTGQYTKSTTADLVAYALQNMDLTWILCNDDATPQKFISDMTYTVAENYGEMDPLEKYQEELRLAFAGQKIWLYDEFGNKIDAIARQGGFMSEYRKILRTFDNCPVSYTNATQGRGKETIERPYLSLLGSLTPKDVRIHAGTDATMWGDGFLARYLLSCPPPHLPPLDEERPRIAKLIPQEITLPLLQWHESLGVHPATIVNEGSDTKPRWVVQPQQQQPLYCHWTDEAYNAYRAYRKALKVIQAEMNTDDLDGNYARLPEQAIRVAMLFAALNNDGIIELRHWARAQLFIEHCRESLHNFYIQVNMQADSQDKQREDKILQIIQKAGRITRREICQLAHEASAKVRSHLQELERDNLIQSEKLIAKNGKEVTWYWCAS